MWGDSEAAGANDPAGLAAAVPGYPPATGLYMLRSNEQWQSLVEPCADGAWPPTGVGPGGLFGELRRQQQGHDVAVINCGVGGTRTDQWLPSSDPTSLYQRCLRRAQAAVTRPGSYLGSFVIYIGANDAAAGMTSWAANVQATQAALQQELGVAPVFNVVLPFTVPTEPGVPYPTWEATRVAQLNWAAEAGRFAVQAPEGPWREVFKLHLSIAGNYDLAQRLLAAFP